MSEWHFDKDVADIKELLGVDEEPEEEAPASAEEAAEPDVASVEETPWDTSDEDDLLNQSDEGLSDEELAVKEAFREKRREEYRSAKRKVRAFRIAVPVLLIGLMIWSFSQMAGGRVERFVRNGTELITGFAQTWYSDWEFEDGARVDGEAVNLEGYLSYNREAQQQYARRQLGDGGVFSEKGETCFVDCTVTYMEGEQFELVVHYYEADGELDQAGWDALQEEGPKEARYIVTVDQSTNKIKAVEAK